MNAEHSRGNYYFENSFLDSYYDMSLEGSDFSVEDISKSQVEESCIATHSCRLQQIEQQPSSFSEIEKLYRNSKHHLEECSGSISESKFQFLYKTISEVSSSPSDKGGSFCGGGGEEEIDPQKNLFHNNNLENQKRKGRPCKFNEMVRSLATCSCIPSTYKKGIMKSYRTQNASRWCHICNRSSTRAKLLPCFNRMFHMCRKSICHYCFNRYYLQSSNVPPCMFDRGKFYCSHCLGICPKNAQCRTYQQTNVRRHIQGLLDKCYEGKNIN